MDRRASSGHRRPVEAARRAPGPRPSSIRRSSTRWTRPSSRTPTRCTPLCASTLRSSRSVPTWFFLHADCKAILDQTETFLKHPPGPYDLPGIFQSDPPRHTRLRELMGPALCTEFQGAPALIAQRVTGARRGRAHRPHGRRGRLRRSGGVRCPVRHPRDPDADRAKIWAWEKAILRARRRRPAAAVKFQGVPRTRRCSSSAGPRPPVPAHRWRQRPDRAALSADRTRPRGRGRATCRARTSSPRATCPTHG